MSMTREEAIKTIEFAKTYISKDGMIRQAIDIALSALRPVSRERVEKVWTGCEKCHNRDNWPSWIEKGFVYCPKCGTPLTSWAWEKQMKRLEALKDGDLE